MSQLTFLQIATLAMQAAKVPGYTGQASSLFTAVLEELAQTYDFDAVSKFYTFNFNTELAVPAGSPVVQGCGPYPMPSDFLRAEPDDVFWTLFGVPYPMIAIDLVQFDMTVQQPGLQAYPYCYAIDMSVQPPNMYVYVPPSGNFNCYIRYKSLPPAVADLATSTGIPWFPSSTYLIRRLTYELMILSDDSRAPAMMEDCRAIMRRILPMLDNPETRSKRVRLDRRRFGRSWNYLPTTKQVGWP